MRALLLALLLAGCQQPPPAPLPEITPDNLQLSYCYAAAAITANKPAPAESNPQVQDNLPSAEDQSRQPVATPPEPENVSETAEPGPNEGAAAAAVLPTKLVIYTQPDNCAPCWRLEKDLKTNTELKSRINAEYDIEYRRPLPGMMQIPLFILPNNVRMVGYATPSALLQWLDASNPRRRKK